MAQSTEEWSQPFTSVDSFVVLFTLRNDGCSLNPVLFMTYLMYYFPSVVRGIANKRGEDFALLCTFGLRQNAAFSTRMDSNKTVSMRISLLNENELIDGRIKQTYRYTIRSIQ